MNSDDCWVIALGIIALCLFGVCILLGISYYNDFVYDSHQPRINTTIVADFSADFHVNNFIDDNTGKGYIDPHDILKWGHKYNIVYYCNHNNERIIDSAEDLTVVVDPYKCVNVNGTCT